MSSRLNEGKVAIVTGAGGGIGREIALALADSGARVVINDIGVSLQGEGGSASPAEEDPWPDPPARRRRSDQHRQRRRLG